MRRIALVHSLRVALVALLLAPLAMRAQPGPSPSAEAGPGDGVVRAVYFFSPTCPACQELAARHLPGIQAQWGPTLRLQKIDVSTPAGGALFEAAMQHWLVPRERFGVPAIFVGGRHLVGLVEIPRMLPATIESGVAMGGVGWPPIPGLDAALADGQLGSTPAGGGDPLGMVLGLGVLLVVAGAMGWSGWAVRRRAVPSGSTRAQRRARTRTGAPSPGGAVDWSRRDPVAIGLGVAGIGVAGYLSWVAVTGSEVLCGPVGSCGAVHASAFGSLAGVPVAVFGLLFFVTVTALALVPEPRTVRGPLTAAAWAGAAFSLYLTGAEVFVIGAVCSWCLVSATLAALLLVRVHGGGPVLSGGAAAPASGIERGGGARRVTG